MMRYMVLLLVLAGMAVGAMTRNDICVEQSRFNQASTFQSGITTFRGATVWMPLDFDKGIWQGWQLQDHLNEGGSTDNVACWNIKRHYKAKFYAGTYIPAIYDDAAYGRPTQLAYPDGAWSDYNRRKLSLVSTGWHAIYTANNTERSVRLTVPANTTRLYMYATPKNNAALQCVVDLISGTATLRGTSVSASQSTFSLHTTGEFGTDHTGFLNNNYCLIAENCGDAVIDFTRNDAATGETLEICGWIAINDNAAAQPDTGVFDPTTVVYLDAATSGNVAEGPLYIQFASGTTTAFLWGMGHWSATQTVLNEAETKVLTTRISASNAVTFTNNSWVRAVGSKFTRTLTGDMRVKNGASAAATVGTYSSVYEFTPLCLKITNTHTFNAEAATQGLKFDGLNSGGMAGKWNVPASCTRAKILGSKSNWQSAVGTYASDNNKFETLATGIRVHSPQLGLFYDFICDGYFYNAAATPTETYIRLFYQSGGTYPKIYKSYLTFGETDIAIADGDIAGGTQYRYVYPAEYSGSSGAVLIGENTNLISQ